MCRWAQTRRKRKQSLLWQRIWSSPVGLLSFAMEWKVQTLMGKLEIFETGTNTLSATRFILRTGILSHVWWSLTIYEFFLSCHATKMGYEMFVMSLCLQVYWRNLTSSKPSQLHFTPLTKGVFSCLAFENSLRLEIFLVFLALHYCVLNNNKYIISMHLFALWTRVIIYIVLLYIFILPQ